MSEHDVLGDAVERLEWSENKIGDAPSKSHRISRRAALTGAGAGIAAMMLDAASNAGAQTPATNPGSSIFGVTGGYRFTVVNHAMTNLFFTPTQNGAADACKLLGCSYQWTGSQSSNVAQMVAAINTAITTDVDGIATSLIDPTAFNQPVQFALNAGIPVVSYNADEPNARLAYIGQDLYRSGTQMASHIKALIPGGGQIAIFVATPGMGNLQPRVEALKAGLRRSNIDYKLVASGVSLSQEQTVIEQFVGAHQAYQGFFAVDAGSTAAVAQAIQKYGLADKGVKGGGYDLTPITEQLLADKQIQFAIDQQPYLQGFLPIVELFLLKASNGLTGAANVDTGVKFLDSTTITPFSDTKSRYEGTATSPGIQKS